MECFRDYTMLLKATLRYALDGSIKKPPQELCVALGRFLGKEASDTTLNELAKLLRGKSGKGLVTFVKEVKTHARLRDIYLDTFERATAECEEHAVQLNESSLEYLQR